MPKATESAYESVLNHIVEPSKPSEREDSTFITVPDWIALRVSDVCRELAGYNLSGTDRRVAEGYAEYIDTQVRDLRKRQVRLYMHTETAENVLQCAALFCGELTYDMEQHFE